MNTDDPSFGPIESVGPLYDGEPLRNGRVSERNPIPSPEPYTKKKSLFGQTVAGRRSSVPVARRSFTPPRDWAFLRVSLRVVP
jgi:hypothetical protein